MDFAQIEGMRGQVTDIDILAGIGGDCQRCPVALAVGRMFRGYQIHIDVVEVDIHKDGKSLVKLLVTNNLFKWIDTFDNENVVAPVELIIRQSDDKDFDYELAIAA